MGGVSTEMRTSIATQFPFATGILPVRYLGLPLLTKRMPKLDYAPLVEKIRVRISTWTSRFLSYAGRVQLICSILTSIMNFWSSAFRLPRSCIKEIDSLCSAFLWSGPDLNPRKAKVAWIDVCKPKEEGGLGIRSLKDINLVCCLKLIWRLVSTNKSLWANWIKEQLIGQGSFWSINENHNGTSGSWMWRKLLKYRDVARKFYKVEVKSGNTTSFWYDLWSPLGEFMSITGARGVIDMGIPSNTSVSAVLQMQWRRRRHRVELFNKIEDIIQETRERRTEEEDCSLWRMKNGKFKKKFSSRDTWEQIRFEHPRVSWSKGVWFTHRTPKFSFITWLAVHNRLTTYDRMRLWNVGMSDRCVLCTNQAESRDHLFFSCRYSREIWAPLVKGILKQRFILDWNPIVDIISDPRTSRIETFLLRYVFQASISHIWRERNGRRHDEPHSSPQRLVTLIDKIVRNMISSFRHTDPKYEDALVTWFTSRV